MSLQTVVFKGHINSVTLLRRKVGEPPSANRVVSRFDMPAPGAKVDLWSNLPALRKARLFRRAELLINLRTFFARRSACAECPFGRKEGSLYGCKVCPGCGGKAERMLDVGAKCKRGLWPKAEGN